MQYKVSEKYAYLKHSATHTTDAQKNVYMLKGFQRKKKSMKHISEVVEKTVHVVFKYLSRTCRKEWRRAEYSNARSATPPNCWFENILLRDGVNVSS
jgi:hypothetical protein